MTTPFVDRGPFRGQHSNASPEDVIDGAGWLQMNMMTLPGDPGSLASRGGFRLLTPTGDVLPAREWAAGTDYAVYDWVWVYGHAFMCIIAHTSSASFWTDYGIFYHTTSKWQRVPMLGVNVITVADRQEMVMLSIAGSGKYGQVMAAGSFSPISLVGWDATWHGPGDNADGSDPNNPPGSPDPDTTYSTEPEYAGIMTVNWDDWTETADAYPSLLMRLQINPFLDPSDPPASLPNLDPGPIVGITYDETPLALADSWYHRAWLIKTTDGNGADLYAILMWPSRRTFGSDDGIDPVASVLLWDGTDATPTPISFDPSANKFDFGHVPKFLALGPEKSLTIIGDNDYNARPTPAPTGDQLATDIAWRMFGDPPASITAGDGHREFLRMAAHPDRLVLQRETNYPATLTLPDGSLLLFRVVPIDSGSSTIVVSRVHWPNGQAAPLPGRTAIGTDLPDQTDPASGELTHWEFSTTSVIASVNNPGAFPRHEVNCTPNMFGLVSSSVAALNRGIEGVTFFGVNGGETVATYNPTNVVLGVVTNIEHGLAFVIEKVSEYEIMVSMVSQAGEQLWYWDKTCFSLLAGTGADGTERHFRGAFFDRQGRILNVFFTNGEDSDHGEAYLVQIPVFWHIWQSDAYPYHASVVVRLSQLDTVEKIFVCEAGHVSDPAHEVAGPTLDSTYWREVTLQHTIDLTNVADLDSMEYRKLLAAFPDSAGYISEKTLQLGSQETE